MRHFVIALVSTIAWSHPSRAQSATPVDSRLDSVVVRDVNGQPVPFATVSIKGGSSRVTDIDGVLLIHPEVSDTINMVVRRIGYGAYQGRVGRNERGSAYHVTLGTIAQALNAVAVKASVSELPLLRNGFYERMHEVRNGAPTGEFFTPEDLAARNPTKISNFLMGSRFAKIAQKTGPGRLSRAYVQGRANCAMTVMIDGVVIHNMLGDVRDAGGPIKAFDDSRNTIDDSVAGQDVMAVEVYPSVANAPTSISSRVLGATCGIVAIWTGARK